MNKKRFLVSIILIISIICISNIGKTSYSYFNNLSGFKDYVFNNNMAGDSQHKFFRNIFERSNVNKRWGL